MHPPMAALPPRESWVQRGLWLIRATLAWTAIEGAASVLAGIYAGSVVLIGFGADSFIEILSAVVIHRRLAAEARGVSGREAESQESRALWIVAVPFFLLAAYIAAKGVAALWFDQSPEQSTVGMVVTACALVIMPLLGRAKRRVGNALRSQALIADAKETVASAWLAAITLVGLALNAGFGWGWADPLAALLLVPLLFFEGRAALEEAREDRDDPVVG